MGDINLVMITGRIGSDVKYDSEKGYCNFSVATSDKYKDKEYTEWHNITFFGKSAEVISKYFQKGSGIALTGRLQTKEWEGKKRTSIIGERWTFTSASRVGDKPHQNQQANYQNPPQPNDDFIEDDIPF